MDNHGKSVRLDHTDHCPVCNGILDAAFATNGSGARPNPGDVCICAWCTTYLIYDDGLMLRLLEVDELLQLPNEMLVELTKARSIFKKLKETKKQQGLLNEDQGKW